MPDARWLWDQPKTWHEINHALQDIAVLLEYLGTQPDGRLLCYFEGSQKRAADGAARRTVPPCASYAEFLSLIFGISSAFQSGKPELLPKLPAPIAGQTPLSAEGFVYWSRDFLSAVAAPATAGSIRLTRDYVIRRTHGWFGRFRRAVPTVPAGIPALPFDVGEADRKMLAGRLAGRVQLSEWITVGVVIVTVLVSIYALSGRLILGNAQDMEQAWSKVDQQVEAQEDKLLSDQKLLPVARVGILTSGLCAYTTKDDGIKFVTAGDEKRVSVALASANGVQSDAHPGLIDMAENRADLMSAHQMHLCAESAKVLLNLFMVTTHLQAWSSVATQRIGGGRFNPISFSLGVPSTSITEYAEYKDGKICSDVFPKLYNSKDNGGLGCRDLLLNLINKTTRTAESILASITQYILPVCYGFLGAMAAALRLIRRRVDTSTLSYTDRARLQQGAILGILCGGVIGLFATYLGKSDVVSGLGLSAVALLAGYNVDGVFRFLDQLSSRIFRMSPAPKS